MSVCVDGSYCYQSYGWGRFRYLGSLNLFLQFVERHHIDELLIINPQTRPVSQKSSSMDLATLSEQYVSIPLAMAGGLESDQVYRQHCEYGLAERFMFTGAILNEQTSWLNKYSAQFGKQSIIGCLPIYRANDGHWIVTDGVNEQFVTQDMIDFAYSTCDELLIQQINHYGYLDTFDFSFEEEFVLDPKLTILNGGIGTATLKKSSAKSYSAAYVDNAGYHSECKL